RRQHSDYREYRIVGRTPDRLAEHAGIAAKMSLPATIAQHGDWIAAPLIFDGGKQAAQRRFDAQDRKEIGRNATSLKQRRDSVDIDLVVTVFRGRDLLKDGVASRPFFIPRRRNKEPFDRLRPLAVQHCDQTRRIFERKRLQQYAVNNAE